MTTSEDHSVVLCFRPQMYFYMHSKQKSSLKQPLFRECKSQKQVVAEWRWDEENESQPARERWDGTWRAYRCVNTSLWSLILWNKKTLQSKGREHAKLQLKKNKKILMMNLHSGCLTEREMKLSLIVKAGWVYTDMMTVGEKRQVDKLKDKCTSTCYFSVYIGVQYLLTLIQSFI